MVVFFLFFSSFFPRIFGKCGKFSFKKFAILFYSVQMEESVDYICAVCFDSFGIRSDKLVDVTEVVGNLIKEWVWYEYTSSNSSCPTKICKSCRLRLYSINRGETDKLSKWMEKLGQVRSSKV